jgi:Ca2+-transporting ATPase
MEGRVREMSLKNVPNMHSLTPEGVLEVLETSKSGLTEDEARARLKRDGPNEIPKVKKPFFKRVAPQIFDFVIILLLGIAAVLALLAWIFPDNESTSFETSIAIVGVILLSWALIVFQMYSAERSLEALRKIAAAKAKVKRNGKWTEVPTSDLVAGDIVMLGEGDRVPADVRIIQSDLLTIDESSLTGESVGVDKSPSPVEKKEPSLHERTNMAFMSTVITRGAGEGAVSAIGLGTELGKIAKRIEEAPEPEIPLQRKMSQLAKTLSLIMFVLIFTLTVIQLLRLWADNDLGMDPVMEQLVNAVILGVVAVPWSFPIITTSVMARGMVYLVKENAIVRRVASIEGLGRVCVICSDKTGTMTQNAMTIKTVFHQGRFYSVTGTGYGPEGSINENGEAIQPGKDDYLNLMITAGYLNNDSKVVEDEKDWKVLGDPTEGALKTLGNKAGIKIPDESYEVMREIPFDSDRKMMTKVFNTSNGPTAYTKGGFEVIIEKCSRVVWEDRIVPLEEGLKDHIIKANSIVNDKAQRTLALAYRELEMNPSDIQKITDEKIETDLILLGFVGMIDPPKQGVRDAVKKCHEAGIRVVMITGDSKGTAKAIAADLGVLHEGDIVLEGSELPVPEGKLCDVSVFCRVSPQQKVDIVKEYRASGQIIAMTGDGMNDAAALKNADVGVAMGKSGTDVAKEASQIILSDDNFATLVTAVHRGRQIFDNIRKSITYQIYTNLSDLSLMFLGSLIFMEQLMSDKQLLFLYFSTHLFPVAALVLDRTTPGVMKEPPRDAKEGIVSQSVLGELFVMIGTMAAIALAVYFILDRGIIDIGIDGNKLATIQTMILTFVVWGECFNLFNSLSMKDSLIKQLKEKNMVLPVLMVAVPISALTFFMYFGKIGPSIDLEPLTALEYSLSVLLGFLIIPVVESYKIYVRRTAEKQTRFSRFFKKSWQVGMSGVQLINDMPSYFQRELGNYRPGYFLGKGITMVGSNIKKAGKGGMGMLTGKREQKEKGPSEPNKKNERKHDRN